VGTLLDEFNAMKIKVAKAMATNDQAILHKKIHVVDHEAERERKLKNPNKSTKVYLQCYSPEAWRLFQTEKDRFFEVAVDPHIAIDLIVRALAQVTNDTMRQWIAEGHHQEGDRPADLTKAEIPEWMR